MVEIFVKLHKQMESYWDIDSVIISSEERDVIAKAVVQALFKTAFRQPSLQDV